VEDWNFASHPFLEFRVVGVVSPDGAIITCKNWIIPWPQMLFLEEEKGKY
jgi:hypothetical protein